MDTQEFLCLGMVDLLTILRFVLIPCLHGLEDD